MCINSIPARVIAADQNDLNPRSGRVFRFRPVILLDNIVQILGLWPEASHSQFDGGLIIGVVVLIAAVLAPLLSMVIFCGTPHWSMALRRKRDAALRSRLAVRRPSTVRPALSTVRYKYFH